MHNRVSIAATILVILVVIAGITVGACSGSNTPSAPSGTTGSGTTGGAGTTGRGASAGGTGTLSIRLTDSPFTDAQALLVTFSEVSVHMADPGDWKMLPFLSGPGVRTCDLTQLTHATDVLGVGPLTPGKYTQIRLTVQSATLYFGPNASTGSACAPTPPVGDTSAPVDIPSGEVKLNQEFTVPPGGATTITLDFNADQSVHATGGGNGHGNSSTKYVMSPVIGVVSVQ